MFLPLRKKMSKRGAFTLAEKIICQIHLKGFWAGQESKNKSIKTLKNAFKFVTLYGLPRA